MRTSYSWRCAMNNIHPDAFLFFGAAGDLAYRKNFPFDRVLQPDWLRR